MRWILNLCDKTLNVDIQEQNPKFSKELDIEEYFNSSTPIKNVKSSLHPLIPTFRAAATTGGAPPVAAKATEPPRNSVLGGPAPRMAPPQPSEPPEALPPPPIRPQQPKLEEPTGGGGVFGGQGFKGIMQNRFKSQFVASGTAGGSLPRGEKFPSFHPHRWLDEARAYSNLCIVVQLFLITQNYVRFV